MSARVDTTGASGLGSSTVTGGIRMAEQTGAPGGKGKPEQRRPGFRRAGALIDAQTRTAAGRRGYAEARMKALWAEMVGPEIAGVARPVKLTPTRGPAGGLLTLGVAGANGPQIQMLVPLIRERVNAVLGPGAVGRVRITQATGFAEAPADFARTEPPAAPPDISGFAAELSSIGDDDLRAALQTLAENVVSRARKRAIKES